MKLLYLLLLALPCMSQTVSTICGDSVTSCGGSSSIRARGFQWKLVRDTVNGGLLYTAGDTGNTGIYSNALWLYSITGNTFSQKVDNGTTQTSQCAQTGAPYDTAEPLPGHPLGYTFAWGNTLNQTGQICGGQNMGYTNRYDMSSQTMTSRLSGGLFGCSSTFNCAAAHQWGSVVYVSGQSKSYYCCSSLGGSTRAESFNGSTYTVETTTGSGPPGLITGQAVLTDGTDLWVYGGCTGGSPGNGSGGNACSGTNVTVLYKLTLSTLVWTTISPSGGPPASINSSFPFMAYDSARARFVLYDATNSWWTYTVGTNTWAALSVTGSGPPIDATRQDNSNGNMAEYDPATDTMVLITMRSQSYAPEVYELAFGGGPTISIPLTIQEALYPGGSTGIARTDEPFTVGVPIADSVGLTVTTSLGLTGATSGQFRILGTWPSGNVKWLEVRGILASLSAGATGTVTLVNSGSGNFGGSDLATDGTPILISTNGGTCGAGSAICMELKKANHNGVDRVRIGATTVVTAGASDGFVVSGPDPASYPGNVTCSPTSGGTACTTLYKSSNDASSTCSIEVNGPVQAVIKCEGAHKDASANAYMKFTARYTFTKGKSGVKVTSILRNADYGTSGTFATAYKGHQGYEYRLVPNLSGTLNYTIAKHTGSPSTGTVSGADYAYAYQGETTLMKWQDWCGFQCVPFSVDDGYRINKNGTDLSTGTDAQPAQGWADIDNGSGVGVQIGVYQMAAYWPKSLEFNGGGTDVRIGIWARQNTQPYYQVWPQHSIHDLYLNFHTSAPASLPNDFLKSQHYLVGRAAYTQYNSSGVFPYQMVDSATEDAFYLATQSGANPNTITAGKACCILDYGITSSLWPLNIFRWYAWTSGGGANQTEFRWSSLLNFITRGMTGRYLNSAHFYRFQAESTWPHSDGFRWIDHPGGYDGFGFPTATSANSTLAHRNWRDQEHGHWYGMTDYYMMTGDETIKDALLDGTKEWFLSLDTYQSGSPGGLVGTVNTSGTSVTKTTGSTFVNLTGQPILINGVIYTVATMTSGTALTLTTSAGSQTGVSYRAYGGLYNTRAIGGQLMGASRMYAFLDSIGDSDADNVLNQGVQSYTMQAKPELCVSGYPVGCTLGATDGGPWVTVGVSKTRGVHWGPAGTTGTWCQNTHAYRSPSGFQAGILVQGLLEFRNAKGSSWSEYWNALDLAYGISRWHLSETYVDNGSGQWDVNGFRFSLALDVANNCPTELPEPNWPPVAFGQQTVHMSFLAKYLVDGGTDWSQKFKINLQKLMNGIGITTSDFGSYQITHLISVLANPGAATLQNVTLSNFIDNGSGSYTISWTVPAGAQSYRIKYGTKTIVDWIGFDAGDNVFTGNPAATMNWFAATNATSIPSPAGAGTTQNMTISTGETGLSAGNFSVRALASPFASSTGRSVGGKLTMGGKIR